MKIIAFNGSPRKGWNTATLLNHALDGAASQGAETELIHLYPLNFKGCASCFECKKIGGKNYGRCALKDDLSPILEKINSADAIILGSPIYFGEVTSEMRALYERLMFPLATYTNPYQSLFNKKINVGVIYSGNITQDRSYLHLSIAEKTLEMIFGNVESMFSFDTYQFDDYSKYLSTAFDPVKKAMVRETEFPVDCKKAFEMGAKFASSTATQK